MGTGESADGQNPMGDVCLTPKGQAEKSIRRNSQVKAPGSQKHSEKWCENLVILHPPKVQAPAWGETLRYTTEAHAMIKRVRFFF